MSVVLRLILARLARRPAIILLDTPSSGFLAPSPLECTKLPGFLVEGTVATNGARVPGTQFQMDPMKAAWAIGWITATPCWWREEGIPLLE